MAARDVRESFAEQSSQLNAPTPRGARELAVAIHDKLVGRQQKAA
jgi:hypothetical protein